MGWVAELIGGEFKCGCGSEFGHLIALGDGRVGDRIHESHDRIGMDSKAKRAALRERAASTSTDVSRMTRNVISLN